MTHPETPPAGGWWPMPPLPVAAASVGPTAGRSRRGRRHRAAAVSLAAAVVAAAALVATTRSTTAPAHDGMRLGHDRLAVGVTHPPTPRWTTRIAPEADVIAGEGGVYVVQALGAASVARLDPATGRVRWRHQVDGIVIGLQPIAGRVVVLTIPQVTAGVAVAGSPLLEVLDRSSGQPIVRQGGDLDDVSDRSFLIGDGDRLLVVDIGDGRLRRIEGHDPEAADALSPDGTILYVEDPTAVRAIPLDGGRGWEVDGQVGALLGHPDGVLTLDQDDPDGNGHLALRDRIDGHVRWTVPLRPDDEAAVLPDGRLLVGARDDADAALYDRAGRRLGPIVAEVRPGVAPFVVDGPGPRLIGTDLDGDGTGRLGAVRTTDAAPLWQAAVQGLTDAVLADRAVYVLEQAGERPVVRALAVGDGHVLFRLDPATVDGARGLAAVDGSILVYGGGRVTAFG